MPEQHKFYTRDIPSVVEQMPGLSVFQMPVYNDHATFLRWNKTEVHYPVEIVNPNLQHCLDAYVSVGKVIPRDMQRIVNAVAENIQTGNRHPQMGDVTFFLIQSGANDLKLFDDMLSFSIDRASTSGTTHKMLFPDRSFLSALDQMATLDPDSNRKATQAYVRQYFNASNTMLHQSLKMYDKWIHADGIHRFVSLVDQETPTEITIPVRDVERKLAANVLALDIYGGATILIRHLDLAEEVGTRIGAVYRDIVDCHKAVYKTDRAYPELDLSTLASRYLTDLSAGFRNLERHMGEANIKSPTETVWTAIGAAQPNGKGVIQNTNVERLHGDVFRDPANFHMKLLPLQLATGETITVFPLGTCPMPIRSMRPFR